MIIYIITGTSGSYSDRNDWNVCCMMDKNRAEEFADKLNRLTAFNNQFVEKVQEKFEPQLTGLYHKRSADFNCRWQEIENDRKAWIKEHYIVPLDLVEVIEYGRDASCWSDAIYDFEESKLL